MAGRMRTSQDRIDRAVPQRPGLTVIEFLVIVSIIAILIAFLLPSVRTSRGAARRSQCRNNLKQIAVALYEYEEQYHVFPPAYTVDAHGNRLHSWRTLILPFIEQRTLYDRIDLSKPWDDPANEAARKTVVSQYICPEAECPPDHTNYMAMVTPESFLLASTSRSKREYPADPAKTLMVIEVDSKRAVHWMSPHDTDEEHFVGITRESPLPHQGTLFAAFGDGAVHSIAPDFSVEERRKMTSVIESQK